MYGYVYLTTNLLDGKKYIGQHCSEKFDTKYFGSGKHLKAAIKKYGVQNFKCELLKECDSQSELDQWERYFIELYNSVLSDEFYNIALGGKCCQLIYQTAETKQKISRANTGKHRTAQTVEENRAQRLNSKWMHKDNIQSLVFKEQISKYLSEGWVFGMLPNRKSSPASEEKKLKIQSSLKGKKKNSSAVQKQKESFKNKRFHWYTNGVDCKMISEQDEIPEGFYRGRPCSEEARIKNSLSHKGKTPWNKGRRQ